MSQRKRFPALLGLGCIVTLLPLASANGQMSHEETVVRQTYATLAYAATIRSIHRALDAQPEITRTALDARISNEAVKFQLTNFSSGKLGDIAQHSYGDLVTKPDGSDVLAIATGSLKYSEEGSPDIFDPTAQVEGWVPGQQVSDNFDIPAAKAFAMADTDRIYSRFAPYTVTALFRGRSRTAKAMFVFGTNADGQELIGPIDPMTGSSALFEFVSQTVYPATLLKTRLRATPVVADWLRSHQVFDASCKPGKEDVCCDPATLECGVASKDVTAHLSKPVSELTIITGP